ncbi:MAG TPA: hypothetical protein VFY29_05035 [Terriglobia bacterium]|nr:hypothetical protein [Terriglobia bacterium]
MDWSFQGLLLEIEASGLSAFVRQSPSMLGFPTIIALHAIGMGLLAGTNAAMDFRVFGVAPGIPLSALERLVPVMRWGFWLNAITGVLLFLGWPTKAITNPVFLLKILLITVALVNTLYLRKEVQREFAAGAAAASPKAKVLGVVSLALWTGAVVSGRLLAYTYHYIDASFDPR